MNRVTRRIAIVTPDKVLDATVEPGTTTADVLKFLGLNNGAWLSTRDGLPFGENEQIYCHIKDGDKLYVSPRAEVARRS